MKKESKKKKRNKKQLPQWKPWVNSCLRGRFLRVLISGNDLRSITGTAESVGPRATWTRGLDHSFYVTAMYRRPRFNYHRPMPSNDVGTRAVSYQTPSLAPARTFLIALAIDLTWYTKSQPTRRLWRFLVRIAHSKHQLSLKYYKDCGLHICGFVNQCLVIISSLMAGALALSEG